MRLRSPVVLTLSLLDYPPFMPHLGDVNRTEKVNRMNAMDYLANCEARIRGVQARLATPVEPGKFRGLDDHMADQRYLAYLQETLPRVCHGLLPL